MEKDTIPLSNVAGKVQMGGRRRKRRGGADDITNEMIEMKMGEEDANEGDYDLLDKIDKPSMGGRRRTKRKRTKKGGRKTRRRKTKSRRRIKR